MQLTFRGAPPCTDHPREPHPPAPVLPTTQGGEILILTLQKRKPKLGEAKSRGQVTHEEIRILKPVLQIVRAGALQDKLMTSTFEPLRSWNYKTLSQRSCYFKMEGCFIV